MQRILVLLVVVILAGSQSRGQSLTEVELEDDYQVATQELEQHCVHRCPDQVSFAELELQAIMAIRLNCLFFVQSNSRLIFPEETYSSDR